MDWLSLIGFIVGIVGLIWGVVERHKAARKYMELRRITWDELRLASRELLKNVEKEFHPDVIFTPCRRGATIANLMFAVDENILLHVGIRLDKRGKETAPLPEIWRKEWAVVETGKYYHYIPRTLINLLNANRDLKLLILDDFAMTGDSLKSLTDFFKNNGLEKENMKTATIVCTPAAYEGKSLPDFSWFKTEYGEFYFPWGKAV